MAVEKGILFRANVPVWGRIRVVLVDAEILYTIEFQTLSPEQLSVVVLPHDKAHAFTDRMQVLAAKIRGDIVHH